MRERVELAKDIDKLFTHVGTRKSPIEFFFLKELMSKKKNFLLRQISTSNLKKKETIRLFCTLFFLKTFSF